MRNRFTSMILILVLLCTVSVSVRAHEVPDLQRHGSVSITMSYQNQPIAGGALTLYRVANVVSEDGNYGFSYTADFADCEIPVTELSSSALPDALAEMAAARNLEGMIQSLDENGKTVFADLELGLYLLVQETAAPGYKKANPFLVAVPYYDNGRYIYDVDTAPKNLPGLEIEPSDPTEPTKPEDPELPYTGQLNWPIPVMAVAGLLLICAGVGVLVSGKKHYET